MYVEERVYRLKPGCIGEYFALYEAKDFEPQSRYLDTMLGYYAAEIGDLNEVVHLWGRSNLEMREERRAKMSADADFQACWQEVRHMIVAQRSRIMKPAPFFAHRLAALLETIANAPLPLQSKGASDA